MDDSKKPGNQRQFFCKKAQQNSIRINTQAGSKFANLPVKCNANVIEDIKDY